MMGMTQGGYGGHRRTPVNPRTRLIGGRSAYSVRYPSVSGRFEESVGPRHHRDGARSVVRDRYRAVLGDQATYRNALLSELGLTVGAEVGPRDTGPAGGRGLGCLGEGGHVHG